MTEKTYHEDILSMLKALADESRLAILRLLAQNEITVGDLAKQVDLGEPTVSHHLTRLREAGLVTLRMAGNQRFYRMNQTGLNRFKQLAGRIEAMPPHGNPKELDETWIASLGLDQDDQQALRAYTSGGKITHLPSRHKKKELMALLRWLATLFEPGRKYTEPEVNEILKSVYKEDYVSLRRDLVDMGYLRRERGGGSYWAEA